MRRCQRPRARTLDSGLQTPGTGLHVSAGTCMLLGSTTDRGQHGTPAYSRPPPTPSHITTIVITANNTSTTRVLAARMQHVLAAVPLTASNPDKHWWLGRCWPAARNGQPAVGGRGLLVDLEDEQTDALTDPPMPCRPLTARTSPLIDGEQHPGHPFVSPRRHLQPQCRPPSSPSRPSPD